jgi:hypothetical protein
VRLAERRGRRQASGQQWENQEKLFHVTPLASLCGRIGALRLRADEWLSLKS